MNSTEIILSCRDLGIELGVTESNRITYQPKSRMTPELLAAIRDNKTELVLDLLMRDATRWIAARYVEGADLSASDDEYEAVGEARATRVAPEEFRKLLREYAAAARITLRGSPAPLLRGAPA